MLTYLAAAEQQDNQGLTYESIEKFQKKLKTHRNVSDQEKGYIAKVWRESVAGLHLFVKMKFVSSILVQAAYV